MYVRVRMCHFCFSSSLSFFLLRFPFYSQHIHKHTHVDIKMHFFTLLYPHSRLFASHVVFSLFTFIIHSTSWLTDPYHCRQFHVLLLFFVCCPLYFYHC